MPRSNSWGKSTENRGKTKKITKNQFLMNSYVFFLIEKEIILKFRNFHWIHTTYFQDVILVSKSFDLFELFKYIRNI